ncbi:AMP-binding protein [Nocardioides nitrophenolicus]|uniref:AMP-binding protein n=1 Tax=Nocardioides nitrophenolicus TaxID=60489 RepID=UPI0027DB00E6|nr:AMP-binding protein [Nocardioides nitrophenolicus]MBM7518198.1 O-succinylbenzoic acid--CoA ligase [Nocardioides nitrophenolicus]
MDFWSPDGSPDSVVAQARAWLDGPAEVDLVVATSGSTGEPKRVRLPRAALLASVRASAARLGASGPWVLALPPSYVAGAQVVLRSLVAGHEPTVLERDGWPAGEGWFVSLVPTQLTRMLGSPEDVAALRRAHTVLLGGGPIGASLRLRAAELGVRVVATYGSAETSGGCVYDGMPLDGVGVALGEGGRIRIAGPTLFTAYDGRPDLTAEVLVDGWFLTSDAGRFDEDGRLVVIGRVDDVIVTGGLNVPGPAVAERLRGHAGVGAAEVLGIADPEWGNRVVAFVVGGPDLDELREWVAAVHPRAWAPRQLVRLDAIPLLANGKPDRQALLRLAEQAG